MREKTPKINKSLTRWVWLSGYDSGKAWRGPKIVNLNPIPPLKGFFEQYTNFFAAHRALRHFRPKVNLSFSKGHYQVKTVDNWNELEEVLRLRYEVFHREFQNKKFPLGLDVDRFDPMADHLVILDKRTGKIVGTYRLIASRFVHTFYSESEFKLDGFLALSGSKLELSRACIHRDYRTGSVIHLLWRGLIQYIFSVDAEYLFGCGSVKTTDVVESARIFKYLKDNDHVNLKHAIEPLPSYQMPDFESALGTLDKDEKAGTPEAYEATKKLVPPLLGAYIKAGAKVCSLPALDSDFHCVDFLTVLKMTELSKSFERKYGNVE